MGQNSRYQSFRQKTQGLALATTLAATPEIGMAEFALGTIFIPAASSITTLTYNAAVRQSNEGDAITPSNLTQTAPTFLPLFTAAGVAVTQTVAAGQAYDMPVSIQGTGAIKITANAAGPVEISLKS